MKPFALYKAASAPSICGLSPADLKDCFATFAVPHIHAFIRQWLTEGVPAIFDKYPFLYDELRTWIGCENMIAPKAIFLVGSARFGFSLTKRDYGRPFGRDSDFDFACVDQALYVRCCSDAQRWVRDYAEGRVQPRTDAERRYWPENRDQLPNYGRLGFLQTDRIPSLHVYSNIVAVRDSMSRAVEKLRVTDGAPRPSRASLRIYRDWDALLRQVTRNLEHALR